MSKSNGTGVFINLPPNELFGAIMALPDPMIEPLFVYCTRIPLSDKKDLLARGPRDAKAVIASDIVKRFHGEIVAKSAEEAFNNTFSKGGIPDDIQEIVFSKGESLPETLIKARIIPSKAEWRRLVDGGAIRLEDDSKVSDPNFLPTKTTIFKIGKRRFVKIVV